MQSLFLLPKSWPKRPSGDARTAQANAIHSLKRDIQSIRARETPACFHQTVGFLQIIHKTIAGRHDMKQLPCTAQLHCLLVTKWSPSSSLRVRRTMERGGRRKQKKQFKSTILSFCPIGSHTKVGLVISCITTTRMTTCKDLHAGRAVIIDISRSPRLCIVLRHRHLPQKLKLKYALALESSNDERTWVFPFFATSNAMQR